MKGEARIAGGLAAPGSPAALSLVFTATSQMRCGSRECEHLPPVPAGSDRTDKGGKCCLTEGSSCQGASRSPRPSPDAHAASAWTVGPCHELDWAGSHCELALSLHDLWECV